MSFAEYLSQLVARDLGNAQTKADRVSVFDLGSSGGSDVAKGKDPMIAEAFVSANKKHQARR
jgi:hypothetical protein